MEEWRTKKLQEERGGPVLKGNDTTTGMGSRSHKRRIVKL